MEANLLRSVMVLLFLTPALAACGAQEGTLGEQQVLDLAWRALEPNTSSHDRANWEAVTVREVTGLQVADEFADASAWGCPGQTPPANREIGPSSRYWFVEMKKRPATPKPQMGTPSPTAPPLVPEPFIYQAMFLLDAGGEVVVRRLFCVVY